MSSVPGRPVTITFPSSTVHYAHLLRPVHIKTQLPLLLPVSLEVAPVTAVAGALTLTDTQRICVCLVTGKICKKYFGLPSAISYTYCRHLTKTSGLQLRLSTCAGTVVQQQSGS